MSVTLKRDLNRIWQRLKILFWIGSKDLPKLPWRQKDSESENIQDNQDTDAENPTPQTTQPDIQHILKDYELWGPFLFTLTFCLLAAYANTGVLSSATSGHQTLFVIYICLVTFFNFVFYLNARLLRARISFLQMASVLGYSLFPHVVSALIWTIFKAVFGKILMFLVVVGVMCFAGLVSFRLLREAVPKGKVWLLLYPVLGYHLLLCFSLVSGGTK